MNGAELLLGLHKRSLNRLRIRSKWRISQVREIGALSRQCSEDLLREWIV